MLHSRKMTTGKRLGKRHMTPEDLLEVAYADACSCSELSRRFHCSPFSARRAKEVVAHVFIKEQLDLLSKFRSDLASADCVPYVIWQNKWDETGEKVSFSLDPGATRDQQMSTWQVMVTRQQCIAGVVRDGRFAELQIEVVTPPIIVLSVSSANMWYGMIAHPHRKGITEQMRELFALADIAIEVDEFDGASSIARLEAHKLNLNLEAKAFQFLEDVICRLHSTKLIESSLVSLVGVQVLSRLYSLSLFLRSAGYFYRLVACLPRFLRGPNTVRRDFGPPPPEAAVFARECCQYLLDNYRLADPTDPPTYGDLKKLGASPGNSLRFSACVPNRQRPQTTPKSQASRRSGAADGSVYRFCAHPLPPDFPSMLHIQNVEFSHPILFDMSLPPRRVALPPPS